MKRKQVRRQLRNHPHSKSRGEGMIGRGMTRLFRVLCRKFRRFGDGELGQNVGTEHRGCAFAEAVRRPYSRTSPGPGAWSGTLPELHSATFRIPAMLPGAFLSVRDTLAPRDFLRRPPASVLLARLDRGYRLPLCRQRARTRPQSIRRWRHSRLLRPDSDSHPARRLRRSRILLAGTGSQR